MKSIAIFSKGNPTISEGCKGAWGAGFLFNRWPIEQEAQKARTSRLMAGQKYLCSIRPCVF